MSRPRITAPAPGAALFVLFLLLLPAISRALPAGAPLLSPATRAALSSAPDGHALLPWQRQTMRGLAAPAAAAGAARAMGTDGVWSELPPPVIQEVPAVYDPVRQSMLIFGGRTDDGANTNVVWELSLAAPTPSWTLLQTAGTPPPPRSGHVLLYDSRRERLLLFGGADAMTLNDCWALDLTSDPPEWGQGLPTGTPPARRSYATAVYDSLYDRAVIFGGADSVGQTGPVSLVGDLWVLPFTGPFAWAQLTPTGTPPSPRAGSPAIYDRPRQRMVLFGGFDGTALSDEFTLSLDASPAWSSGGPPSGRPTPSGRAIPGFVYVAPQDQMVMFGGFDGAGSLSDIWSLDLATFAWTQLSPTGGPPSARQFPATVYDTPHNRMVMFGGNTENGTVLDPLWALSLGATFEWTDLGGQRPPQLWLAAAAFDPTRRVMWVHGGVGWNNDGPVVEADLWSLPLGPLTGWNQPATTGTPLGTRSGHSAVYDASRDRLVFFGGTDDTMPTRRNDVWTLALSGTPAWSQLSPSGTPPAARMFHSAVYDAVNDRMVVFGGSGASGTLNDVWALSFAGSPAWTELAPTGTPPPQLWGQAAALEGDANRMIVFGGEAGGRRNNVYALTLTGSPGWTELLPTGAPPAPRQSASMVSLGTHMLVFGGDTEAASGNATNDTWLLSFDSAPAWRQLDVGPLLPPARMANCIAFDPTSLRLAIFGGTSISSGGGDTWILQLEEAVPTMASLVSANAEPGRVELSWEISSSAGPVTVYRNRGDGPWTELGRVAPDGTGRIAYVDLDVIAGSRYGYRLGLLDQDGEVFAGEVWVDVPEAAQFVLRGMTPNPAPAGAGLIGFSLPDASPARLELMDVSGRHVFSREVGSLGRGEHVVRVSPAQPLAPGLYLVRLTQGGRSLTAKAVTIR
jgi:hypothetical protein